MTQHDPLPSLSRRRLLAGAAALSILPIAGTAAFAGAARAAEAAKGSVPPDEALKRLMDGNARYIANKPINGDYSADRASRAAGQAPFAAIVSCSDSRVAPELIFDQGPGELFVVRVAGNFIDRVGLASLEFGAAALGIQLILVLGHTGCGAVVATIDAVKTGNLPPGHLPSLVAAIKPAVDSAIAAKAPDLLAAATVNNALGNAARAQTAAPILAAQHRAGKLQARGGIYDIATGKVSLA